MRVKTPEILLAAVLALLAPAAYARPHKAARPAHSNREAAGRTSPAASHPNHQATAKGRQKRAAEHARPQPSPSHTSRVHAGQHLSAHQPKASARLAQQQPVQQRGRQQLSRPEPVRQPARTEPTPSVQPAAELPPIHVTHDRKQHLTPAPPEANAAPATEPALAINPAQTAPTAALYNDRGRLIVPPALKGSHEILLRQNQVADQDGLLRIQDDEDLERMRSGKVLVALPAGPGIQTDERLPYNRRFCRPWTAIFLAELARAHYARFHTPLQVNSAVRTVEFQQRLLRTNGNAAPAEGETASPHLTGQAVDLAKHGLSLTEIAWLRGYLLPLVQEGKVDVEEEFQQACFHISVYKKYLPQPAPPRNIVQTGRSAATALAVAIP